MGSSITFRSFSPPTRTVTIIPGLKSGWPGAISWLGKESSVRNVRVCASASGAIFVTVPVKVRPSNASAVTGIL